MRDIDTYFLRTLDNKELRSKVFDKMVKRGHMFCVGETVHCESNIKHRDGFFRIKRLCYIMKSDGDVHACVFMEKQEF